mmetsp:Transcript_99560/g.304376  ORF Transcript_99560/g.304376 Transcript_99560/m.304376 type:complete len:265 (-) Transcript_99560:75-869(-)
MMKGLSNMVMMCRSVRMASSSPLLTTCCLSTVFSANRCPVEGSLSSVTRPNAPLPRMPIRSSARTLAAGSSRSAKSSPSAPSALRRVLGVFAKPSVLSRERKPCSFGTRSALYFAKPDRSSSAARLKSSAVRCPASRRKCGPSSTRHSAPASELTCALNSEGQPRSKARSPKCCGGTSRANSSSPPSARRRDITISPRTKMYHINWRPPSRMSESPCRNLDVTRLCANCTFSCDRRPCRRSTRPRWRTTCCTSSSWVRRMMCLN